MQASLEIKIQHDNSIDIVDLNNFLIAISALYVRSNKLNKIPKSDSLNLKIKEVRSGSSIFELIPEITTKAIFPEYEAQSISLFIGFLQSCVNKFLDPSNNKDIREISKEELKQIKSISDIVAKDGSQNSFLEFAPIQKAEKIEGDTYNLNFSNCNIVSQQIGDLLTNLDKKIDSEFENKILQITQISKENNDKRVNKGIIEDFSEKSLQLKFNNEKDREAITQMDDNCFNKLFLVKGKALSKSNEYVYYIIDSIEDHIETE